MYKYNHDFRKFFVEDKRTLIEGFTIVLSHN